MKNVTNSFQFVQIIIMTWLSDLTWSRDIRSFYVRSIYEPALRLLQSISDLPQGNLSNLYISRANYIWVTVLWSIHILFTHKFSRRIHNWSGHLKISYQDLWSTYSHLDFQQESAIDLLTHRSSVTICYQPIHIQIFKKNPQLIYLVIDFPLKFIVNLFVQRSLTRIHD